MTARPQDSEALWQELRQTLDGLKEDPKAWRRLMDELSIVEGRHDPDPYFTPAEVEVILSEAQVLRHGAPPSDRAATAYLPDGPLIG